VKNIFEAETKWVVAHEKLIIVIAVLATVLFLGNRWMNKSDDKAIANNAVAQQVLQERITQNENLAKQLATQLQQYQQIITAMAAQNTALANSMKQRQVEVQQQQKIDQTLPLPDLAIRWEKLANLQPIDIQNTDKGLAVSEYGSRATVQILETVPALQQDKKDLTTTIANKDTELNACNGVVKNFNEQVVPGLKAELVEKDKACVARLDLEKADARKSKKNWFIRGVVSGAAAAVALLTRFLI
jgi:hypothetical protein